MSNRKDKKGTTNSNIQNTLFKDCILDDYPTVSLSQLKETYGRTIIKKIHKNIQGNGQFVGINMKENENR